MKTRKLLPLCMASVLAGFSTTLSAQVPKLMQYQLMVVNPAMGQIRTNENVRIVMELRSNSADGPVAWKDIYSVTTDKMGMCSINVNFNDSTLDWGNNLFYLSTEVDGVAAGTTQLTSVPYAIYSDRAKEADRVCGMSSDEFLNTMYQGLDENRHITEYYNYENQYRIDENRTILDSLNFVFDDLKHDYLSSKYMVMDSLSATTARLESKLRQAVEDNLPAIKDSAEVFIHHIGDQLLQNYYNDKMGICDSL